MSIVLRPIEVDDIDRGYFKLLSQLTIAPALTKVQFHERLHLMHAHGVTTLVACQDEVVIGTGSLVLEPKLTRGGSFVGHVEDVLVDAAQKGKGLGRRILQALCDLARDRGCYKVILNCNEENVGFYSKCGFTKKETQMRLNIIS